MKDREAFVAGLDAKDAVKQERRYRIGELSFREDKITGNICVFIDKTSEKLKPNQWLHTLMNIEDGHEIQYVFSAFAGHIGTKSYLKREDEERYGVEFNEEAIYTQLFGEKPGEKGYTLDELKQLISTMNEQKGRAKYNFVSKIIMDESIKIPGVPNELLVATNTDILNDNRGRRNIRKNDFYCLSNPEMQIDIVQAFMGKEKYKLRVKWKNEAGESQTTEVPDGKWRRKLIYETYENFHFQPRRKRFDGFTLEALTKILEERNKGEKGKQAIGG